jgi:transcriptional regulator with XRE-family HTH domain
MLSRVGYNIRAARSLVGMDQQAFADKAEISINTVRNMKSSAPERIRDRGATLDAVVDALMIFVEDGTSDGGIDVRLEKLR